MITEPIPPFRIPFKFEDKADLKKELAGWIESRDLVIHEESGPKGTYIETSNAAVAVHAKLRFNTM